MAKKLSRDGLKALLQLHVVEIVIIRRNEKHGVMGSDPFIRRMLCTLDKNLLQSLAGRLTFNYQMATHPPAYNPVQKNVVFAWDLLWQDWRAVAVEGTIVVAAHPTHTNEDQLKFWTFFNAYLAKMSPMQKMQFMRG